MTNHFPTTRHFSLPPLLLVSLCLRLADAQGVKGHIQLSPYADSNVQESLENPVTSAGLKLKGDFNYLLFTGRWSISGDVLGQTFLDPLYPAESKLVVKPRVQFLYPLTPRVHLIGEMSLFQKSFLLQTRSYHWRTYSTSLQVSPFDPLTLWVQYVARATAFITSESFRFHEKNLEIRTRYRVGRRVSLEGAISAGTMGHRDYNSWGLKNDTLLVPLQFHQKDESVRRLLHVRYQGKVIVGLEAGLETVTSNSVLGAFDLITYRAYLSGRWGESIFYHLVAHGVDKNYQNPGLKGTSGYRDPEERIQNRTYFQVERVMTSHRIIFLQVSLLKNETVLNRRYYDKTMVEAGVKLEL